MAPAPQYTPVRSMPGGRRWRRALVILVVLPLVALTACGGGGGGDKVTIVGQKFTEADIMTQLYKHLLADAGFETEVKNLGTRDIYLDKLESGDVQVSADYLASMTEAINREVNGEDAPSVATSSTQETLAKLKELGKKVGLTPLQPARAADQNAYAVTEEFAEKHDLKTLSDLGELDRPITLAANSDCKARLDCAKGLEKVYGIEVSKVVPLGFDSRQTKQAAVNGEVDVAQVATTDATLDRLGLVVLADDKDWQHAENLVPIVNTAWLEDHPDAADALNKLSDVLTTQDLAEMNAKVDAQRLEPEDVAEDYLEQKGLID